MSDEVIRNRVGISVMMLRFGKYRGSSAGRVVLADPGYAAWALGQPAAAGGLADLRREVIRLVGRYDGHAPVEQAEPPEVADVAFQKPVVVGEGGSTRTGPAAPWRGLG